MTIKRAPTSGRGVAHGLAVAIGIPPELAVPAGEWAVAAMMALKQAREAGGGMLRGQHLRRAQQHIAALDPARHGTLARHLQAHALALQGRGGDTRIAHVTPGEVVVPKRLQNPEFLGALQILAHAHGIDPATLRVGSGRNVINPRTGQMEFDDYDGEDDTGLDDTDDVSSSDQTENDPKDSGDSSKGSCSTGNMSIPPGVSVGQNAQDAAGHSPDLLWFYNQVRNKGPWDYKQQDRQYQDFGNFNYGVTGAALGVPDGILRRAAGWAQEQAGTGAPQYGHWWGGAPYGDDPADQDMINKGILFYKNGCVPK